MPKKLHPFQRELQERSNDKARIERELKLRQRIHRFADLSEKEPRQRFAILIAEKQRQLVTLAGYCVHSTLVPAIVPILFFPPTEQIDYKGK